MPVRARACALILSLVASLLISAVPAAAPARAAALKVAIIVGPVAGLTDNYRSAANRVATAATAAGATVAKAYSPSATWAKVKAAVSGANIVVYFGHGNGYPNPYTTGTEYTDRVNGWGLNRTTANGDGDNWSTTMVYCGEKALLGSLTSSDGAAQWSYCGGKTNTDGIAPAPGFVMVYGQAHYAPGFGERYKETDPLTTLSEAQTRVRNYSYPVLKRGASGYIATAYGDSDDIVRRLLTERTTTLAEIFSQGEGYSATARKKIAHPDVAGAEVWVQRTVAGSLHFGDPDYWYAFAGHPARTPSGSTGPSAPEITRYRPSIGASNTALDQVISATFDQPVTGVSDASFYLRRIPDLARIPAVVSYNSYWQRAELRPSAPLTAGTEYIVTALSGITTGAGAALDPIAWRFSTPPSAAAGTDVDPFNPAVRLTFRQGTHTGYRFDAAGRVTSVRTVSLAGDSGASASSRATLPNQSGRWFSIVNGAWAGYWIRESNAIGLPGTTGDVSATATTFDPAVRLSFGQGTHTGYHFDAAGRVTGEFTGSLAGPSGANTTLRRSIDNQFGSWFYIANGYFKGYWMRESDVIALP